MRLGCPQSLELIQFSSSPAELTTTAVVPFEGCFFESPGADSFVFFLSYVRKQASLGDVILV